MNPNIFPDRQVVEGVLNLTTVTGPANINILRKAARAYLLMLSDEEADNGAMKQMETVLAMEKVKVAALEKQVEELKADKQRLDWLEKRGNGTCLIHDDFSRWACNLGGMQPVTQGDTDITKQAIGGTWAYFADPEDWKPNIRQAIDDAIKENPCS